MKRSITLKFLICICLVLSSSAAYRAQSAAATDPVMRAMADELKRSISELQFKDLEKPYFIQYNVLDQERYRTSATFGALGTNFCRTQLAYAQRGWQNRVVTPTGTIHRTGGGQRRNRWLHA